MPFRYLDFDALCDYISIAFKCDLLSHKSTSNWLSRSKLRCRPSKSSQQLVKTVGLFDTYILMCDMTIYAIHWSLTFLGHKMTLNCCSKVKSVRVISFVHPSLYANHFKSFVTAIYTFLIYYLTFLWLLLNLTFLGPKWPKNDL